MHPSVTENKNKTTTFQTVLHVSHFPLEVSMSFLKVSNLRTLSSFSLGEAPGPAFFQLWPSGGGPSRAGVRPELPGSVRSPGHSCSAEDTVGPSLQHPDPRAGTPSHLVGM